MYICDFSRSEGAGSATTRNTRGLTRSVIALIVPPLPAPSRPSKITQTLRPAFCTHCCSLTSSTCRALSALSYAFPDKGPLPAVPSAGAAGCLDPFFATFLLRLFAVAAPAFAFFLPAIARSLSDRFDDRSTVPYLIV